jgi:MoxR-like ATPase
MSALLHPVISQISQVILGKQQQIKLTIACLLARGHLLIEDLPGVGKTTLAHALARTLGLEFQRIQFTSDLLPADIVGVTVFDRESSAFNFHPGPVFSQVILADEVNRATPKAQSALLEAMEEHQVTVDGNTRALPEPFFVIATQNPSHQVGTFPLPESQLDRFLMRIHLGYPDTGAERELLEGRERRDMIDDLPPVITPEDFVNLQKQVRTVVTAPALLDYLQAVLAFTRNSADYLNGLSPRAGLYLLHAAKAWAFMDGRQKVIPEDLQTVLPTVVGHRLSPMNGYAALPGMDLTKRLIEEVAIP